ncbi:MAG: hypothetical protein KatS3mg087_1209 [Patescibacteria group bacterium]|nr:MAG: hypothetical protein KatS3mg087_1209 [Patescibacteria group bacterium]
MLYFLTHRTCRIITTSAKEEHLVVLWGEIEDAIVGSRIPLTADRGGPLIVHQREIKRIYNDRISPTCYIRGMVASAKTKASLQGHHAKYTLFVVDEASSVEDFYFNLCDTWAKKKLIVGNPWDCSNYFRRAVEGSQDGKDPGGDIIYDGRVVRRVIRITAEDSPNVKLGLAQSRAGLPPTNEILIPGILTYGEYVKRRKFWDEEKQAVSLDALFYKGPELLLFPPAILADSMRKAEILSSSHSRRAVAMGIDGGEGRDSTVWTIVDDKGIIEQISVKTPDTSEIVPMTIALIKKHFIQPSNVFIDRGGGGKEHADLLRRKGFSVKTVGFGERPGFKTTSSQSQREAHNEISYAYKNKRAEMYGILSNYVHNGFAIPSKYKELIRQLSLMPKKYDSEGRLFLPPKDNVGKSYGPTIKKIVGRSPDEADSLALAVYALHSRGRRAVVRKKAKILGVL